MRTPESSRRETRLDPYFDSYARRTSTLSASAVRALFAVANRPEIVSLAGGMPNIADLPLTDIGSMINDLVTEKGHRAMQYGSGQGELALREDICRVMSLEGILAQPDDVLITAGSQQGLDLVTRIFCDPGDVVLAEAPSYVGALGTFRSYEAEVIHVELDEYGISIAALRETVERCRNLGRRPKFLYTIPNFQNPSGITQTMQRRRELVDLAQELNLLVVEDNPYGLLSFDEDLVPAIRSISADRVLYLGSFSKTFAPGFRVGWVLAPHAVREKLVLAQESATLCPPVFSQFVLHRYLSEHDWQAQVTGFKKMYRTRRDAMLESLTDVMPSGTSWTKPAGGFFVWVKLPDGLDSQEMLARAITARVAYTPGTAFFSDGRGSANLRLSFCYPSAERIREGVRRLGEVVCEDLETHQLFGLGESPIHLEPGIGPVPDQS